MLVLSVGRQLELAVKAPLAARHLRARSAAWLLAYLAAAGLILGVVAYLVIKNQDRLIDGLISYVLPVDWKMTAKFMIKRLFGNQEQAVITNAVLSMSLMVVTITLFPLKEKVSAALEEDAKLLDEPFDEHPLWFQALEEAKLFLAMIAAQATIFWIGYSDDETRRTIALVLSYVVLFAGVGFDFLCPILQRHKQRYSVMVKTLLAHPFLWFTFGAIFALPAIITARVLSTHSDWSPGTQLGFAFAAQVVGIALAAIGGTVAGAPLLADAKNRTHSRLPTRIAVWALLIGLLAWNAHRFYVIGTSLNHKSQLLKCQYDVDWSSFGADVPSALDLMGAYKSDAITVGMHFVVQVTNPTKVDVEIEDNRLEVKQADQVVALTSLPRMKVKAGGSERVTIKVPLTIKPSQALRIRELLTTKNWAITLWLQIDDDFEFPFYLLEST